MLLFGIMCIEILWIYVCVTVWYRVNRDFVDICLCYCLVTLGQRFGSCPA